MKIDKPDILHSMIISGSTPYVDFVSSPANSYWSVGAYTIAGNAFQIGIQEIGVSPVMTIHTSSRVDFANHVTAVAFSGSFSGDGSDLTGITAASSVSASYAATASYHKDIIAFGITIDGGGSVITTGQKGSITIPKAGTITSWQLVADQVGSIVIDVWKVGYDSYPATVGNTIAGTEKPTLSLSDKARDNNLTTWTTAVTGGEIVTFNVDSVSTVTRVNLVITLETY